MSESLKFNHHTVTAAVCPPGRKDVLIFDEELPGFGLRITAGGSKTFIVQYRLPGAKRRMAIGRFGVLTTEEARRKAKVLLGAVADRRDPFAERQAAEGAKRVATASMKAARLVEEYTFARLIAGWREAREGERSAAYLKNATGTMKKHFAHWLDRPAAAITSRDAVMALDAAKRGGAAIGANRSLACARSAYSWAVRQHLVDVNPLRGLERPSRERPRDRVLSAEEIGAIWRAADAMPLCLPSVLRVLMLTLQRRGEVTGMQWDELAPDLATWTIPADRAKNGKAHLVHLSSPVKAILNRQARIEGCPYVFPGRRLRPMVAYGKEQLDAKIASMAAAAGTQPAQMPGWVLHDFRRAGVTILADLGHPPHVCDALLNHVSAGFKGVQAVYQRARFLSERKAALEGWADYVLAAANGRPLRMGPQVELLHAAA